MIYNDINSYEALCLHYGIKTKSISQMDDHEKEIMDKHNLERTYFGYQKKIEREQATYTGESFPENLYWD